MNPENNNDQSKNKFIHEVLFDEADIKNAGTSSSGQVVTWGVGGNQQRYNDVNVLDSTQVINMISNDYSDPQTAMFDSANFSNSINGYSVVNSNSQEAYQTSVEQIVNDANIANNVDTSNVSANFAQNNPVFYGYNVNQETMVQNNQSTQIGMNYTQDINNLNNPELIQQSMMPHQDNGLIVDDNLASNQPLAMMALSGEALDEEQKPKDVFENSKFFQSTPLQDNRIQTQDVAPVAPAPVVDPLADPKRPLNMNELIKSYVGIKYQDISMSSFNFWAGFFGPLYFYYRKMYFYGIIYALINVLTMLLMLVNPLVYIGGSVVIFILACLITNSMYLGFAKTQVFKIAASMPKANQFELQKICQNKGGTSILLAILINIGVGMVSGMLMSILGIATIFTSLIGGMEQKKLPRDNTPIGDVIEYTVPDVFVEDEKNSNYLVYYETDIVDDKEVKRKACVFNIGLVSGHETSKDLITFMADSDKRYNRVSTYKTEVGDSWDMYDFKSNGSHEIYRAKKINGHIVLISYISVKGSADGVCDSYLEEIMNSVIEK